jgi:hemerythrin superfamily protein
MAKTKATDILSLIEAEHRQVKKLFAEAEKAKGAKLLEQFNQIYIALNLHARTEELVFYPAMREHEETEQYIEEAEE